MPSVQTVSDPAPQAATRPLRGERSTVVDLAELRQLTLESGRIIDLPVSILTGPAPKPSEFLHLQHYFEGRRGAPINLADCESADDAIDLLADEIEAIRLLLYGYVVNFKRYVDRFEDTHATLRREIDSVGESYQGLAKLIAPARDAAYAVEEKFLELEKKLARLPVGGGPRPPKFKKSRRGGLANPPLSQEETQEMRVRQNSSTQERLGINAFVGVGRELDDAAILKEAMEPPRPAPQPDRGSQVKKVRPSQPLTHDLTVKINKVVDNVQEARELLQSAQLVTTNNLAVLRYRQDEAETHVRELWKWHDETESSALTAGKVSQLNEGRIAAYDKWASKCQEHAAASQTDQSRSRPCADHEDGSVPRQISDAAATRTLDDTIREPTPSCPVAMPPGSDPGRPDPLDGDLYAITMDLSCDKPYDELSREEAISILKSLPLRVHFVPYIAPEDRPSVRCNAADPDSISLNGDAKAPDHPDRVEDEDGRPCPPPGEKTADASSNPSELNASPTASERARCETKPRSRKRTRGHDDGQESAEEPERRAAASGPPRKKKRGSRT
ncbi:hypothetical protein PYCCODRAFT_977562 [Trametes coccinea BRFM310]|uniref:Uncharacterized protein n=1 Tax=Trametes coccinea (strain BRFM310) TaxID=1353009 RepID=A0A1Y2IBV7_TRAC3|nr:hypothetical protein PYCCODRAFT_977562 [Trametes coccinea BRFM310]